MKVCAWDGCGALFAPDNVRQKYCCSECRKKAENKRKYWKRHYRPKEDHLSQKAAAAAQMGISYGLYVAKLEGRI